MPDIPLVVVDASVAVKWFVSEGEDAVDEAELLLEAHADGSVRLVAPALMVHELFSVLCRGGRGSAGKRGASGPAEATTLREAMDAFFDSGVTLIAPDRDLMESAASHVQALGASPFDAVYSALARALGCELATADRKLARKLGGAVGVRLV